jgi:hypothetical protein
MKRSKVIMGMFAVVVACLCTTDAGAGGYGSLGSAWYVNTYSHDMLFSTIPGDVNNEKVFFQSFTKWYDVQFVCRTKGGAITLAPGIGQSDLGFVIPDFLTAPVGTGNCQPGGDCTATVTYPSRVDEVHLYKSVLAQQGICSLSDSDSICFQKLYNLSTLQCQNKQGTLVEIRTKGVCAVQTAIKCDSTGANCTPQASQGYNFVAQTFDPATAVFTFTEVDSCEGF